MTTHNTQVIERIFPPSCDPCAAGIKLYDLPSLSALGGPRNLFHFQSEITLRCKLSLTVQHLRACPEGPPSQRLRDLWGEAESRRASQHTGTCPVPRQVQQRVEDTRPTESHRPSKGPGRPSLRNSPRGVGWGGGSLGRSELPRKL